MPLSRMVLPRVGAPAHPFMVAASPVRQVFGPAVALLPGPELPASGLDGPQGRRGKQHWGHAENLGLGARCQVPSLRRCYRVAKGQLRN